MGNIISNILITIIGDWHILLSVIGAGYWFGRQTKKALQKELQKEIKGVNARIDDHEKSVSERFDNMSARLDNMSDSLNTIQADLAEIKAEVSFEKRVSKLEKKLEGQQPPAA